MAATVASTCQQRASRRGREVRGTSAGRGHQESGWSPLLTTTASLAAPALTTELLQATSATTTAGAPVVSSPLFAAHLYSRLVVGRRGRAPLAQRNGHCVLDRSLRCAQWLWPGLALTRPAGGSAPRAQRALAGGGAGPCVAATRWSPGPYCRCSVKRIGACLAVLLAVSTCADGVAVVPGC